MESEPNAGSIPAARGSKVLPESVEAAITARRQLPNRPFLAALHDLIRSDPRTADGAQIVRWTDGGAGSFVVQHSCSTTGRS